MLAYVPDDESRCSNPGSCTIESRTQGAQELGFPSEGRSFVGAWLEFDSCDRMQQSKMTAAKSFRISHAITAQAFAQIPGFPDVKDTISRIAHKINSRALRKIMEELSSQPFDQWPGVVKEQQLFHSPVSAW